MMQAVTPRMQDRFPDLTANSTIITVWGTDESAACFRGTVTKRFKGLFCGGDPVPGHAPAAPARDLRAQPS